MAYVFLDRVAGGYRVAWQSGAQPTKEKTFADRAEADYFAVKKMGATGSIVSTLDMTPAQLAAHAGAVARQEAAALGIPTRDERRTPRPLVDILSALRNYGPEGVEVREKYLSAVRLAEEASR